MQLQMTLDLLIYKIQMFVTSCCASVEQSMLPDWYFQINSVRTVIPHQLLDRWGHAPTPQVGLSK